MPVAQLSVINGGQATFRNVRSGGYTVEAEASGYSKAREEGMLPMAGEVHVEIYLRPEVRTDAIVLSDPGVPLLAPKARKELEAGQQALIGKDLKQAQKHLDKAAQLAPTHPDVLYLLGILYSQMNDLPKAEEFLLKVAQLEPQQPRAHAALGVVLANERKFAAALPPLGKALELDSKSWEARWAMARCHYYQRKYEAAAEEARKALRDSNGKAPEIGLVVAASLTALGRYEESAEILREFLHEHPDNRGAARAKRWLDRLHQAGKVKQN
jgi:tetratricopeptide (TPR) repeat protein